MPEGERGGGAVCLVPCWVAGGGGVATGAGAAAAGGLVGPTRVTLVPPKAAPAPLLFLTVEATSALTLQRTSSREARASSKLSWPDLKKETLSYINQNYFPMFHQKKTTLFLYLRVAADLVN